MNLGNPEEFTIREWRRTVIAATGSRSVFVIPPFAQDDPLQRRPDISRAGPYLGWSPRTNLDDGLARAIDYFQTRLDKPVSPCRLRAPRRVAPARGPRVVTGRTSRLSFMARRRPRGPARLALCWPMFLTGGVYVFPDTISYLRGGEVIWSLLADQPGAWSLAATDPAARGIRSSRPERGRG